MKYRTTLTIILIMFATFNILPQKNVKTSAFSSSVKFENNKEYEKALKEIRNIYPDYKDDYLVNVRLGWLNYLNKKQDESIKFYNETVRLTGRSIESLLGLTLPYSAKNDWDKVKDIYEEILSKDDMNYTANLRLGQIYLNRKDYLNAKKLFSKLYYNYPGDYSVCLYLGWTYYYLGSSSKAKEFFKDTLILYPGNKSATNGLELVK